MKFNFLVKVLLFFFCVSINAQKKIDSTNIKPTSIYTFSKFSIDENSFSSVNNRLNLTNLKFVFIDIIDMELNQFSVDSNNLGKTPSEFISDDFERYQNENLLKGFLIKNDPTRWNFHCPSPLSVQPTE